MSADSSRVIEPNPSSLKLTLLQPCGARLLSHYQALLYHCCAFKNRFVEMDFGQDQQTQNRKEVYFCVLKNHQEITTYAVSFCDIKHTK